MRLTILGEYGPYPAAGGACSSYLLETRGARVLLDAGPGALATLYRHARPELLDAVVLTHWHYDHMSDLLPMVYALSFSGRKTPIPLYAPAEPANVRALLPAAAFSWRAPETFSVGGMAFSFAEARHPVPAVSVRVEEAGRALVYTGDTNEHAGLEPFARNAELLLADAGLLERDWTPNKPHLSAKRCGELAKNVFANRLLLTHLSPSYAPEIAASEACAIFPSAECARAGRVYEV